MEWPFDPINGLTPHWRKPGGLLKGRRRAEYGYTVNARPAACFYCVRHRRFNAGDVVRRSRPDLATTIRDCPTGCSIPANNKHGFSAVPHRRPSAAGLSLRAVNSTCQIARNRPETCC